MPKVDKPEGTFYKKNKDVNLNATVILDQEEDDFEEEESIKQRHLQLFYGYKTDKDGLERYSSKEVAGFGWRHQKFFVIGNYPEAFTDNIGQGRTASRIGKETLLLDQA